MAGSTTSPDLHVGLATDLDRYVATDALVWALEPSSATAEEIATGLPEELRFAAEVEGGDPATYAGIYGVYPMTLAVPGPGGGARRVKTAGLTWVGVHPDHRRRGVLTAMLRHHAEQVHADPHLHTSVLHASEPAIYGRHGYGLASLRTVVTVGKGTALAAPHLEAEASRLTTHLVRADDPEAPARLHECHLATAEPGSVVGDLSYYARICRSHPEQQRGKEPLRVLFARRDGVDVGFAVLRRSERWERDRPAGEVKVWALLGEPVARLVLLRRLVDLDLMTSVRVDTVGLDDPLLRWVGGPRGASDVEVHDNLWVRLVDLPRALEARAWSAPCDIVVDVDDATAPWNQGCWRISADADGTASVERTPAPADLALRVEALGAAYLGAGSLATLHRAGHVLEHRPGAVAALSRAMRTDLAPAAAVMF